MSDPIADVVKSINTAVEKDLRAGGWMWLNLVDGEWRECTAADLTPEPIEVIDNRARHLMQGQPRPGKPRR